MNHEALIEHESSRRGIYQGLAQCYYNPEKGLKAILQELGNRIALVQSQALSAVLLMCNHLPEGNDLKNLQTDYARLFVGPYSLLAPPYGSVYLDSERLIMGRSTMDVIQFYRQAGLQTSPDFKEAPDHIAVELEFMYFLIDSEISALAAGEEESVPDILMAQQAFLNGHLNQWIQEFARAIKNGAQTDFYVDLADATACFISEDADYLLGLNVRQAKRAY